MESIEKIQSQRKVNNKNKSTNCRKKKCESCFKIFNKTHIKGEECKIKYEREMGDAKPKLATQIPKELHVCNICYELSKKAKEVVKKQTENRCIYSKCINCGFMGNHKYRDCIYEDGKHMCKNCYQKLKIIKEKECYCLEADKDKQCFCLEADKGVYCYCECCDLFLISSTFTKS